MALRPYTSGNSHIPATNLFTTAIPTRKGIAETSDPKRRTTSGLSEWAI
jgi:hypothetical protein